jgi:hypothetical protein
MKTAPLLLVAVVALSLPPLAWTQQEILPEARPSADEVRALRLMVEKQGQQIDDLRRALEELKRSGPPREANPAPPAPPAAEPAPGALAPLSFPATPGTPTPPAPPPPSPTAAPTEVRVEKAEPAHPQHTVAKGETLTSIAKHYNVTIADLHKANKVVDERKLQIGQVLNIPSPKSPEPSTDKKEKP